VSRTKHLATTVLAGLLLGSSAFAGPRKTPPAQLLTPWERICKEAGTFAYRRGLERDWGWSLTDALQSSRTYDREQRAPAWVARAHDEMLKALYAEPSLTPTELRQLTEAACINNPPQTPRADWR
jgi:hypothetical protein